MSSNETNEQQVGTSSNAKRIIGIAVITTLVAGLAFLSGCNPKATSNPTPTPPATATPKIVTDPPPIIVKSGSIHFESEVVVDSDLYTIKTKADFPIVEVRVTTFNLGTATVRSICYRGNITPIQVALEEWDKKTNDWIAVAGDTTIGPDGQKLKMTTSVELDEKKTKDESPRKYQVEDKKKNILRIRKVKVGTGSLIPEVLYPGEELSIGIFQTATTSQCETVSQ